MKDESVLPFTVAVTPFYDETAALADLVLPDATYLERFEVEAGVSPDGLAEYALRQPVVEPLAESRDFQNVCCQLAERMGLDLGFDTAEAFVSAACRETPEVKRYARGFRGLKSRGVWHDNRSEPEYGTYARTVDADQLAGEDVVFDEASGVYWNWRLAGAQSREQALEAGYAGTPGAAAGYLAQQVGEAAVAGFKPGRLNKSGLFEIHSPLLAARGLPALPSYVEPPSADESQLMLSTFKHNVQMMSATANSGWLSEIEHANPAWLNPVTAAARGIADGDTIEIRSRAGTVQGLARLTETVAPGVLAMAVHGGRWEGGRYAAGKRAPFALDDAHHDRYRWWTPGGTPVNRIVEAAYEPISGQQNWMDTRITVTKV